MTEKRTGLIYIKKRSVQEYFTYIIFLFPFIMAFLLEFLRLPSFLKYAVDVMYVCSFLAMIAGKYTVLKKNLAPFAVFTLVFLLYTFVVYLFNFQSPFYFLWGVRNNFRFYIAFFLFSMLMDEDDSAGCLKLMDAIFWCNAAVSFFQFLVMGYRQDYLGGIFGVEKGCNAFTIVFFAIVISKSLLLFMNKQENALKCFLKCGTSLVIAAMSELKVYFILFVIILIASAVMTRFSFRKVLLLGAAAVLVMFSGMLLPIIFGESRALTFDNIIETITAKNYATSKDLGRFTAIPTISRDFLTGPLERLFGMGLGNCDTSSFDICNSPFYQTHAYLNYNWFSSAFMFLETGYTGLALYLSFFVICFVFAWQQVKKESSNELFCRIGMIMAVVCVILVFYNASLRTEIAYMAFFSLALPFVGKGEAEENLTDKEVSAC